MKIAIEIDEQTGLTWAEKRVMWRIEAEQEKPEFVGFSPRLSDLAWYVGISDKTLRKLVNGLTERGYLEARPRGKRVRFALKRPLGGQFALAWDKEQGEIVLSRQW